MGHCPWEEAPFQLDIVHSRGGSAQVAIFTHSQVHPLVKTLQTTPPGEVAEGSNSCLVRISLGNLLKRCLCTTPVLLVNQAGRTFLTRCGLQQAFLMLPESIPSSCTTPRCNAALTSGELMNIELLLSMLSGSIKLHSRGPSLHAYASLPWWHSSAAEDVAPGEGSARAAAVGKACCMLTPCKLKEAIALQVASCV